ncbi:hypothetical protein CC80DRAFT_495333 [Byssothecium circinans]|uniref:Mid2 domain-containing protein n=1 Tax=Byssothecium circinans TaxID=147558 RepID=A0A6A5TI92_9PLEO|nr:hypothetical protein CC80DRAFT_495333 [Byssothecium circinans]
MTCYLPNGTARYWQPCSSDTSDPLSNVCCALDRTIPAGGNGSLGLTNDECLPNGVCMNRAVVGGRTDRTYWRNACTDKEWTPGKCFDICSDGDNANWFTEITPCEGDGTSKTWCCGKSTACCKEGSSLKKYTIDAVFGRGSASTVSSSTATTISISNSSSASPGPSTTPVGNEKHDTESLKLGVGLGVGFGVLVLMLVAAIVWLRFFKKRKREDDNDRMLEMSEDAIYEAEGGEQRAELPEDKPAWGYRFEMEGMPAQELA